MEENFHDRVTTHQWEKERQRTFVERSVTVALNMYYCFYFFFQHIPVVSTIIRLYEAIYQTINIYRYICFDRSRKNILQYLGYVMPYAISLGYQPQSFSVFWASYHFFHRHRLHCGVNGSVWQVHPGPLGNFQNWTMPILILVLVGKWFSFTLFCKNWEWECKYAAWVRCFEILILPDSCEASSWRKAEPMSSRRRLRERPSYVANICLVMPPFFEHVVWYCLFTDASWT